MVLSSETTALVRDVQTHSGNRLRAPDDLAVIVELARSSGRMETLDDLVFTAKFLWNTFSVMRRIGENAEGFGRLWAEFSENADALASSIRQLLASSEEPTRKDFERRCLEQSHTGLQGMLDLVHDLSWLKNLQIDTRSSATR